jgi:ribonucleoside-triphosphate reductase (thioredoxin)
MIKVDARQELSNFVFTNSYARFNHHEGRRETFAEAIDRMVSMHKQRYPGQDELIDKAFSYVRSKKVLASQRALQFGGPPILAHNMRMYNCATSFCDRIRFFSEAFYMGLCGAGVGFSIQRVHTDNLPPLITDESLQFSTDYDYVVEDSIEGWASALDVLLKAYMTFPYEGVRIPVFDYSEIRRGGAPLSSGGKAPGPEVLEEALSKVEAHLQALIFDRKDYLEPIDCLDIVMYTAEAVLSGGRRRAATIAIFDQDDDRMLHSKTGAWTETHKHRQLANISARIPKGGTSGDNFKDIFRYTKEFGEPGFVFTHSPHHMYNPCVEIGMCPVAIYDNGGSILKEYTLDILDNRARHSDLTYVSGWQVCNLTEINAGMIRTPTDFKEAVWAATVIGTLQAGYTDTGYLDKDGDSVNMVSKDIIERESLLGVSMTGIMESYEVAGDPHLQAEMAQYAIQVNTEVSEAIGIPKATRVTCVKPAGTTSIILGTSSGVHPNFAHNLIRHVQVSKSSPVANFFKKFNPEHCEESAWNDKDYVLAFPLELPPNSKVRDDFTAKEFLDFIRGVQKHWVVNGTSNPFSVEGITHNVSNTVRVLDCEWQTVASYLWEYRDEFTGVALIGDFGESLYPQLPNQTIHSEDHIGTLPVESRGYHTEGRKKWLRLKEGLIGVDYNLMDEGGDRTSNPILEIACGGGQCEIP